MDIKRQMVINLTEKIAIDEFRVRGIDISTREKRVALPKHIKKMVFEFCMQLANTMV